MASFPPKKIIPIGGNFLSELPKTGMGRFLGKDDKWTHISSSFFLPKPLNKKKFFLKAQTYKHGRMKEEAKQKYFEGEK